MQSTKNICVKLFIVLLCFSSVILPQEETVNDTTPKYSYATVEEIWSEMDDIFSDPAFSNAFWGVVIKSLDTGEFFYKRNANKLFVPASNLKLITTALGLQILGFDYQFKTEFYAKGNIDGSILNGDLIIKGYGDPTISARFYDSTLHVFNMWADSLLEKGIDEIKGNIIGDDNVFDERGLGEGWAWDYESYWYSAPSGALSFNDNCIDISVFPTISGESADITVVPETNYILLNNKVVTVSDDSSTSIDIYRERGTNIIYVYGTITESSQELKTYATVHNPTQYTAVVFKDVLESRGIKVKGYAIDYDDVDYIKNGKPKELLFTHYSVTLDEIIKVINKNSQNFFAEQLLKVIGYENANFGSAKKGLEVLRETLRNLGMNPDNMILVDGSGLSRLNMVTPSQIVTILDQMYRSDLFPFFYNSLPVAGMNGTLAFRMRKTRAQDNVRAKTGFLGSARSLSGYVHTGDNEPIAFCLIANNYTVPSAMADRLQDYVCIRLANFKRK